MLSALDMEFWDVLYGRRWFFLPYVVESWAQVCLLRAWELTHPVILHANAGLI